MRNNNRPAYIKPKARKAIREFLYTLQIWYDKGTKRVNWQNCKLDSMGSEDRIKRAIKQHYPTATAANKYNSKGEFCGQIKIG
jgi:hypothetical protein